MQDSPHRLHRVLFSFAAPAAVALSLVTGCGKGDPALVEAAVIGSIYSHLPFLDEVCGFALHEPLSGKVQVIDTDAEELPWFGWIDGSAPGTARIRVKGVHKEGVAGAVDCESKIGFTWKVDSKPITDRIHRANEREKNYTAEGFKKL